MDVAPAQAATSSRRPAGALATSESNSVPGSTGSLGRLRGRLRPVRIHLLVSLLITALALVAALGAQPVAEPAPERAAFDGWLRDQAAAALNARQQRVAALTTREALGEYQQRLRQTLAGQIGVLPTYDGPLRATVTRTTARAGYRIEHLAYDSLPGLRVTALLYVPDGTGPFPAVVGTAGHANEGKASPTYQHAWVSLARRGFVVLALDPPGQGERLEYLDDAGGSRVGIGTREHMMTGLQVLLTGRTIGAYMVQDSRRGIDYLLTRPEVDAARIAVAGNSGGGTQAALLAAVEPRLAAAVVSCYMTSWRDMWDAPGPQDSEQVLPGFLGNGLDFADFAIAAAPRGFLVSSAIRDFFPIAGSRDASAELTDIYARLGAAHSLARVETDAEHGWSQPLREGAYRALGRWLGRPDADRPEEPVTPEPVDALRVTDSGQVAKDGAARTIRAINADEAMRLAAARPSAIDEPLSALLGQRGERPRARLAARTGDGAASPGERLLIDVENGVRLPARLRHSAVPTRRVVVLIDDRGATTQDATIDALTRAGQHVLALDVRGTGVLGPLTGRSGYAPEYQFAARSWLLGTSVVGWQVQDVRAGLSVLEQLLPSGPLEITLMARGQTGPAAVFASRFAPVAELTLVESLVSYREFASADIHEGVTLTVVPGILRVTDLPDVMARLTATRVRLVRSRGADGRALGDADTAALFGGRLPTHVTVSRE